MDISVILDMAQIRTIYRALLIKHDEKADEIIDKLQEVVSQEELRYDEGSEEHRLCKEAETMFNTEIPANELIHMQHRCMARTYLDFIHDTHGDEYNIYLTTSIIMDASSEGIVAIGERNNSFETTVQPIDTYRWYRKETV